MEILKIKDIYTREELGVLMHRLANANDWLDQIAAWGIYIEDGSGPIFEYEMILAELFQKIFGETTTDAMYSALRKRDESDEFERWIDELYEYH